MTTVTATRCACVRDHLHRRDVRVDDDDERSRENPKPLARERSPHPDAKHVRLVPLARRRAQAQRIPRIRAQDRDGVRLPRSRGDADVDIVDFEDHFDELSKDWRNIAFVVAS